jgi:hypothetical protein
MESVARVIEAEIDLATGIVIEQVAEQPERPRRRLGRSLVVLAAIAGLGSGLAVGAVRSSEPTETGSPRVVRTGVQAAKLRSDDAPCTRRAAGLLVCGTASDSSGGGTLHE